MKLWCQNGMYFITYTGLLTYGKISYYLTITNERVDTRFYENYVYESKC